MAVGTEVYLRTLVIKVSFFSLTSAGKIYLISEITQSNELVDQMRTTQREILDRAIFTYSGIIRNCHGVHVYETVSAGRGRILPASPVRANILVHTELCAVVSNVWMIPGSRAKRKAIEESDNNMKGTS